MSLTEKQIANLNKMCPMAAEVRFGDLLHGFMNAAVHTAARLVATAPDAAAADAVHAAVLANAEAGSFDAITNPDVPRNVTATFAADWDGGDIVVTGTDQFGNDISETLASHPGNVRTGTKIFATIVSIEKSAIGESEVADVTIGTGTKIGVALPLANTDGQLTVNNVGENVTLDATNHAFTPTTAPDGTKVFRLIVNVKLTS